MDLAEYERVKFELAGILRSATAILREKQPEVQGPFTELFGRLAEDRFNLVVVGRFNRGKTSLMNAMLETERLPTGIVPLTSVVTTVSYGTTERAFIDHEDWSLAHEIALDELPGYVTQQGNPGNQRRVAVARVELPAELLRRGFHFVDTPGLGSSILENTRTTERFLPEADAFMVVTSYDSPLSDEELRLLQGVAAAPNRVFLVINKHDMVSRQEQEQVLWHVRDQARRVFGEPPQVFSVSARDAIEAHGRQDLERLSASGVPGLKEKLTRFLLNEKQTEFLVRMCERIAEALREVPNSKEEADRLRSLHRQVAQERPNTPPLPLAADSGMPDSAPCFSSCRICSQLEQGIYDFLRVYQYDVMVSRDLQAKLAEQGGLCDFHTWQYEALASARGTCLGFSPLVERLAVRLREIAATSPSTAYGRELDSLRPTRGDCELCHVRIEIEQAAVAEFAVSLAAAANETMDRFSGLCLDHLRLVVEALETSEAKERLMTSQAAVLERLSEDMRRYALKYDGMRRYLANAEELTADRRALMVLAGHRNVNGLWKLQ